MKSLELWLKRGGIERVTIPFQVVATEPASYAIVQGTFSDAQGLHPQGHDDDRGVLVENLS